MMWHVVQISPRGGRCWDICSAFDGNGQMKGILKQKKQSLYISDRYTYLVVQLIAQFIKPPMSCTLWNDRSICSRANSVAACDYIVSNNRDVFVTLESWHDDALTPALALACPPNYCVIERARPRTSHLMDGLVTHLSTRFCTNHKQFLRWAGDHRLCSDVDEHSFRNC